MADAGQRISSLSSSSLPQPDLLPRPLKHRTPSAVHPSLQASVAAPPVMPSFHSKSSYSTSTTSTRQSVHTRATARNPGLAPQLPTMDPAPGDPDAVFIHPPFTDFPDAYRYKEGLTYSVLATHPDWFLDPTDYQQLNDVNPGGMKYPSQLEPPRGWCPAKKREAKDGWAEGEEPRLRCTFCRRTYAGVNAKSMWRRHVFEKHKIAMANRRENQERKGRNANKENKEGPRSSTATARGAAKVETQSVPISSSRSTYRLRPAAERSPEWRSEPTAVEGDTDDEEEEDPCVGSQILSAVQSFAEAPPRSPSRSPSPPRPAQYPRSRSPLPAQYPRSPSPLPADLLSPSPPRSRSPSLALQGTLRSPSPSSPIRLEWLKPAESPYNPLLTPSFRHSPPRLPSAQPWRFPNPNHPLHSGANDLSLCMLAQAESSPTVRGLDVSPVLLVPRSERTKQSIFSSPISPLIHSTPDRRMILSKATPRRLFSESMLPTPLSERLKSQTHRSSPLAVGFTPVKRKMLPSFMSSDGAWAASSPAKSPGKGIGLLGPIHLDDPFTDGPNTPWDGVRDNGEDKTRSPPSDSSPELESPVLRASQLSRTDSSYADSSLGSSNDSIPSGFNLLDAISLRDYVPASIDSDDDDDEPMFPRSPAGPSWSFRKVALGDGSPASIAVTGKRSRRGLFSYRDDGDGMPLPKKRMRIMSEPRQ